MQIRPFAGDREVLRPLFREADDSEQEIDGYLGRGDVLVATDGQRVTGYVQLVPGGEPGVVELKSMAVDPTLRGAGIGQALVEAAVRRCRAQEAARLTVATAAAGTGQLRFYQRQGFRLLSVERDAFGPHTGYDADASYDGIPLRDRVWLDRDV